MEGGEKEEKKKTIKLRHAPLNWPSSRVGTENTNKMKETKEQRKAEVQKGVWVEGRRIMRGIGP